MEKKQFNREKKALQEMVLKKKWITTQKGKKNPQLKLTDNNKHKIDHKAKCKC